MTKQEKFVERLWRRFFGAVGRTYSPEAMAKPEWYLTSSWTARQEDSFRDWLTHEMIKIFHQRKKQAQFEASMFLLFYGWRIENPEDTGKKIRKVIRRGERDVAKGDTMTHERAKRRMRKWLD